MRWLTNHTRSTTRSRARRHTAAALPQSHPPSRFAMQGFSTGSLGGTGGYSMRCTHASLETPTKPDRWSHLPERSWILRISVRDGGRSSASRLFTDRLWNDNVAGQGNSFVPRFGRAIARIGRQFRCGAGNNGGTSDAAWLGRQISWRTRNTMGQPMIHNRPVVPPNKSLERTRER